MDAKKIEILEALYQTKGIVTPACELVDLARSTYYKWLKDDDEFRLAVDDIQDVALDFAEGKLYQLIDGGDTAATIFLLKTRGKKRGYIERSEVDNMGTVQINITDTDSKLGE